jgi:FkbM family methyltransferase
MEEQSRDFVINFKKYESIFNKLEDDESKSIFEDLINFRLTGNLKSVEWYSLRVRDQYFEDFLRIPPKCNFLVAGGYDGDTTQMFCNKYIDYNKVFIFEPDIYNINRAKERLISNKNINFINKALSDKLGKINFRATGNIKSHIDFSAESTVDVTTIDVEVKDKLHFIKTDLEGYDLLALYGAKNHIKENKPSLAIAVYHQIPHIHQIYEFVLNLNPFYRVRLRHYTEGSSETIMYFIPESI